MGAAGAVQVTNAQAFSLNMNLKSGFQEQAETFSI
jgi:hypothetical protein